MKPIEHFTETFRVMNHDCDWNNRLTAGALLRMGQQIATDNCTDFGMDEAFYEKNGVVFLLARTALRFDRTPQAGEVLTFTTMPEDAKRAIYKRVTVVKDEKGEQVAMIDSRWVLVSRENWRILRHAPEAMQNLPFAETVTQELPMDILVPEELEEWGNLRAEYSRCDQNGHMNNTHYADAAADALPQELLRRKTIREMVIRYHKELPAGETALVQRGHSDENHWYVLGMRDDKKCFEAGIVLTE